MFQRESKNSRKRGASINRSRKATDAGHQIDVIVDISIRTPRGGSDWGYTPHSFSHRNFNPRSPWGERRGTKDIDKFTDSISIHAPRGGSDLNRSIRASSSRLFQSTLPVGGATLRSGKLQNEPRISIHAPRGGSDWCKVFPVHVLMPISIHAPRGGSDAPSWYPASRPARFQSTLPVGGATCSSIAVPVNQEISIHTPRGGSDVLCS